MGYSSWDSSTYRSYSDTISTKSTREVFTSRSIKPYMDPKDVVVRESRDSEAHPNSTPIILALDVTGSMGMIADHIARTGLGELVEGILEDRPITDPHIMVMGIGDVYCDTAPLQVTQFESDIRIAEQLQDIWLEGGGGGNTFESYDLPWYFAAKRTSIDCFEKHNRKGYLFTFGDELPPPDGLTASHIKRVFGNAEQAGYSSSELLESASEMYHVFHVIVEQGSFARSKGSTVVGAWREILNRRAIRLSDYKMLSEVVLAVISVSEGADPEDVIAKYQDQHQRDVIRHALFD